MSLQHSPRIITDGLVLCLDAASKESYSGSGTVWRDLAGSNNGDLTNGPTFSSANGGSIVFDGVDDKGTFTSPIVSSSSQTYEIWAKAIPSSSSTDGFAYLLHNNSVANIIGSSYLVIGYAQGTREIFGAFNAAWNNMLTGIVGNTTTIRQIVLTWNGATQIVYVDGIQRNSTALTTTPQNFSTVTSFGDDKNTTYRMIQGSIYSIKVYNRALTPAEILQNYNALKGRYNL